MMKYFFEVSEGSKRKTRNNISANNNRINERDSRRGQGYIWRDYSWWCIRNHYVKIHHNYILFNFILNLFKEKKEEITNDTLKKMRKMHRKEK